MLWGWCGFYGAGCAASCAPYSRPHFYTYWLTSYLADSLQNLGHHANRVEQGSTLCSSSFDALIKRAQVTYTTSIKCNSLRVGASIQQAHHFARTCGTAGSEPVVTHQSRLYRLAGGTSTPRVLQHT